MSHPISDRKFFVGCLLSRFFAIARPIHRRRLLFVQSPYSTEGLRFDNYCLTCREQRLFDLPKEPPESDKTSSLSLLMNLYEITEYRNFLALFFLIRSDTAYTIAALLFYRWVLLTCIVIWSLVQVLPSSLNLPEQKWSENIISYWSSDGVPANVTVHILYWITEHCMQPQVVHALCS